MTEHALAHEYEPDRNPEIVENGKAVRRLELLGLNETMADPEARRQLFAGMDNEKYQEVAGYINSVTLGETISYEYGAGGLQMQNIPAAEDKARLMDLSYEATRSILSDPKLSADEALQQAGLTLAGAINYVHPHDNGNGRTGRIMHYLISYGSERGKDAFEAELYGAIAKLPAYGVVDPRVTIFDTPPAAMENTILEHIFSAHPEARDLPGPQLAGQVIETYLEVMKGDLDLRLDKSLLESYRNAQGEWIQEPVPAGTNLSKLYDIHYRNRSFVPNNEPSTLPPDAQRIIAVPETPKPMDELHVDLI